jgi:putative transposase
VTMRVRAGLPSLRSQVVLQAWNRALGGCRTRGFRVVGFSLQADHVHLLVEASDGRTLARGMQGLSSGFARRFNRCVRRRGKVFGDRYHRRDLASSRQARNALVYVLQNHLKHEHPLFVAASRVDRFSSAPFFDGWVEGRVDRDEVRAGLDPPPLSAPRSWVLRAGWRRHGAIDPAEGPRTPA